MKAGSGRGGRLEQDYRNGSNNSKEEGPKRDSLWLDWATAEAMKAGSGIGGWLGQDGRDGFNQGHEEGPIRGTSRLDSATTKAIKGRHW
jgi:hypothetical protein